MEQIRKTTAHILAIALMAVFAFGFFTVEPASAITWWPSKVKDAEISHVTYDTVTIGWSEAKRAEKYEIYRARSKRGQYRKAGTSDTLQFTDRNLETGSQYWYKVRAVNGGKHGFFSSRISTSPRMEKPRLKITATGDGPVLEVSAVPGASGYVIYRDGKYVKKQKNTVYTDMDVAAGEPHMYRAVAYRYIGGTKVVPSPASVSRKAYKERVHTGLDDVEMIPTITKGDKFTLSGKISSNATISTLEIGVVDAETGEWVEGFKYEGSDIGGSGFDVAEADEEVPVSALEPGSYKYRICARYLDGKSETLMDSDFTVRETSEGGEAIIAKAAECAWPYGTSKSKYKYPSGNRTDAYTSALKEAYGSRGSWGAQTKAGASCDVFVGTVVRASGYDTEFPRGLDGIEGHISQNRDKWDVLDAPDESELRPGDVVFQIYKGGGGHVMIYLGDGKVANAHYNGKSYGVIQDYSSQAHSKGGCKTFKAYRPIN